MMVKNNKKQLFEMIAKLDPKFKLTEGYDMNTYDENPEMYKQKAEKIKGVIDQLVEMKDYDVIDTLYRLMVDRKMQFNNAVKQISEMLDKE